ncbi:26S proteasome non-ATPase regulatory subunit Nas2 [Aulographum hederae CBS 113979]|uniref:Probable 26S proteasome regulatory subunit p27 n=1 Tax=Aulographum hederae CBS 113979 TaxID=1176131 RepID=A0A6G1H6R7_9PEZI|nr:26S proteasome non-ATPase regulatory subunit Nas2 [Aulographum hederae CBS 113979]
MGLRMDDLHTPSVSSGPTSNGTVEESKEGSSLMHLINQKDKVEAEMSALFSVLRSHNVTMTTTLTTFDGYPRDDIDIAQIRTTRARIIHLKNDYKSLMARIEEGLHAHHASMALEAADTSQTLSTALPSRPAAENIPNAPERAFAKVNSVAAGSPAETADLKAGDQILQFGAATWLNHEKLSKVAEVVSQNEGRPILVKILRNSDGSGTEKLEVQLTPRRNWGGRGMLGCHLLQV